jgi:hypothetical protein
MHDISIAAAAKQIPSPYQISSLFGSATFICLGRGSPSGRTHFILTYVLRLFLTMYSIQVTHRYRK